MAIKQLHVLVMCYCAEIRDNHRDECEKCLKELEELIRHEELQVEAKQSTSGQFHWLIMCMWESGCYCCVQANYSVA